jgi:5-formyltetrahydrofolate cyclo-ligase
VLAARDALPPATRSALGARIAEQLRIQVPLTAARRVLGYLSFGSEFDTAPLLADWLARGVRVALPRVNRERRALELYFVDDLARDTVAGVWGIREPAPDRCPPALPAQIEAVLAPGVAFTPRCERLGYGGGFYDRLLGGWRGRPPVVAAAFAIQVVAALPCDPGDIPVDAVVTEDTVFTRRG